MLAFMPPTLAAQSITYSGFSSSEKSLDRILGQEVELVLCRA